MHPSASHLFNVKQGQFRVSADPDDRFFCVLGSCIATVFHDPVARIGGMNHFLLPGRDPGATGEVKYGAHAMEQLVNALLRAGAAKHRLEVSLFGGAKVIKTATPIGANNARFAEDFVRHEGFRLKNCEVGGLHGRRLVFMPASGATSIDVLQSDAALPCPAESPPAPRPSGSIELF
ncbi:MAG: chemotaxis protein CheD [Pseudomonadota bacterium]